jgi:hypothetical protein
MHKNYGAGHMIKAGILKYNLHNVKDDPNEWNNLAGDEKYPPVMQAMRKSAPDSFAPGVTPKNELRLVVEGDSFRWEKKKK